MQEVSERLRLLLPDEILTVFIEQLAFRQFTPVQETFYVFAFIVVISSFLIALFLAKVVGIRIREYPLNVDREWRDARPANPFRFPWNQNG